MIEFFGKRNVPVKTPEKGFDALEDAEVLGRFFMADQALRDALHDWAEIMQNERHSQDTDRLDVLTAQIQERIDALTQSDRGSRMTRDTIAEYVRRKMIER